MRQRSIIEQFKAIAIATQSVPTVHTTVPCNNTMSVPPPLQSLICATDGSCTGNGTKRACGGYSAIFEDHPELSIAEPLMDNNVTNNRCEYMGLIRALEQVPSSTQVHIYSDSMLLVNTINKWMASWKKKGWKRYDGGDVQNLDLIKRIDSLKATHKFTIEHIRAHTNKKDRISILNDRADFWAKKAAQERTPQLITSL
jgi:ribonuclease HI